MDQKNKFVYSFQENKGEIGKELLDDVDLRKLLKISRRTAYNYRKLGLKHYKINKKTFYFLEDVYNFIRTEGGGSTCPE